MSTHHKPAAVPIRHAAPALIPATVAGWVTLPEIRPIITLTAAVLAAVSIYAWTQTHTWGPRARTAVHALGRTLGWALTVTGKIAHIIGRILRAVLWALGFVAFLSIVGYALGLGGNQQRHH